MTLAYVSAFDSLDVKKAWSGTGYFMAQSLENQANLDVARVGPLRERYKLFYQGKQAYHLYLGGGKTHIREFEPSTMRDWARQAEPELELLDPDVILSPTPHVIGGLDLSGCLPTTPRVLWTDATFDNLIGYYERYSNLSNSTLRNGHRLWDLLVENNTLLVFSSEWAAQSAIERYDANPRNVHVVSFGTNMEEIPSRQHILDSIEKRPPNSCRLLFLSVDWKRKGGPLALAVTEELLRRGVPSSLTVVGCQPEVDGTLPDAIHPLGFIPKTTREGRRQLSELLSSSHFLILPSLADCTPMVIAEANAHGLPALVTNTGGIGSLVSSGVNGQLFDPEANSSLYADYVMDLVASPSAYGELARSARREQEQRLNWDTASAAVASILKSHYN